MQEQKLEELKADPVVEEVKEPEEKIVLIGNELFQQCVQLPYLTMARIMKSFTKAPLSEKFVEARRNKRRAQRLARRRNRA